MRLNEYLASMSEWGDDDQIRGLFSSFSQPKDVNPEAFDARLKFWTRMLLECTKLGLLNGSVFCIPDSSTTAAMFTRKGSRPLGLNVVLVLICCLQDNFRLTSSALVNAVQVLSSSTKRMS